MADVQLGPDGFPARASPTRTGRSHRFGRVCVSASRRPGGQRRFRRCNIGACFNKEMQGEAQSSAE